MLHPRLLQKGLASRFHKAMVYIFPSASTPYTKARLSARLILHLSGGIAIFFLSLAAAFLFLTAMTGYDTALSIVCLVLSVASIALSTGLAITLFSKHPHAFYAQLNKKPFLIFTGLFLLIPLIFLSFLATHVWGYALHFTILSTSLLGLLALCSLLVLKLLKNVPKTLHTLQIEGFQNLSAHEKIAIIAQGFTLEQETHTHSS